MNYQTFTNHSLNEEIRNNIINPNYIQEIKEFIKSRRGWRKTGITFETLSKILIGVGSILSFSAGIYNSQDLSFYSGSISTMSLVCLQFSSFAFRESKKSTNELNILLKKLGIDEVPEVIEKDSLNSNSINNNEEKII